MLLERDEELPSWDAFLETFHDKYYLEIIRDQKEMEFLELVQGNKTMAQYAAKFMEQAHFALHIVVNETHVARRFEHDLRPNIQTRISALKLRNFAEFVYWAMIVEKDCEDFQRVWDHKKHPQPFQAQKGKGFGDGFN